MKSLKFWPVKTLLLIGVIMVSITTAQPASTNTVEQLFPVNLKAKWGFMNPSGEMVITNRFRQAQRFADGLAAVQIGVKWGFVDATGKVVIKQQF
ncbi:MAG: WG repeat-containing protein, partial [Candidatus Latescibacteria bacterium]|nr:WG repeat-containing protein [Candidatus Latescibacterota bacterium]